MNNEPIIIRSREDIERYRLNLSKKARKQERQVKYDANLISSKFEAVLKVLTTVGNLVSVVTTNHITNKIMGKAGIKFGGKLNWLLTVWPIIKGLIRKK